MHYGDIVGRRGGRREVPLPVRGTGHPSGCPVHVRRPKLGWSNAYGRGPGSLRPGPTRSTVRIETRACPGIARVFALCVVAYAFSPIDLIPDFVPVLGYLDDLILIPLGIALAIRMIPPEVLARTPGARPRARRRRKTREPGGRSRDRPHLGGDRGRSLIAREAPDPGIGRLTVSYLRMPALRPDRVVPVHLNVSARPARMGMTCRASDPPYDEGDYRHDRSQPDQGQPHHAHGKQKAPTQNGPGLFANR